MATPSLDPIGKTLGGYRIVQRLGAGGMGTVYKAHDPNLDRFVAIKVLAPALEDDPSCVERFKREARTIASLRHPNLMHIYSVGTEDGLHFFAMELVDGRPLADLLKERGPLPVPEACRIAGQIMGALDKVHAAGVVHRDLKPGNIMIDGDGRAVVLDFGLAKDTSQINLTGAGTIMGTPDYMAPEQVEGDEVGPATDVYALGIILFQMLTGQLPFRRKSAILTMRAHCEESLPAPCSVRPDLPPSADAILAKACAKKTSQRYAAVRQFATDLARLAAVPDLLALQDPTTAALTAKTITTAPVRSAAPQPRSPAQTEAMAAPSAAVTEKRPAPHGGSPLPSQRQNASRRSGVAVQSGVGSSSVDARRASGRKRRSTAAHAPVQAIVPVWQKAALGVGCVLILLLGVGVLQRLRNREQATPAIPAAPAAMQASGGATSPATVPAAVPASPETPSKLSATQPAEKPRKTYRPRNETGGIEGMADAPVRILLTNGDYVTGLLEGIEDKTLALRLLDRPESIRIPLADVRLIAPRLSAKEFLERHGREDRSLMHMLREGIRQPQ